MAVFGSGGSRSFGGRGPSFGFRFFCYAIVSVVLMFYDRRGGWLETARYGLQATIYPLQLAVNSPSAAWRWVKESVTTREALQKEVDELRNQLRDQQLVTMRQAALERENATLRGLNSTMPEVIEKRLIGEVINVEVSTLRQRLLINRGGNSGVYRGQPVITGDGVLGQVYRTGPFSSEIILITDSEHALPVQVHVADRVLRVLVALRRQVFLADQQRARVFARGIEFLHTLLGAQRALIERSAGKLLVGFACQHQTTGKSEQHSQNGCSYCHYVSTVSEQHR